ncbi:DUF1707 and FHA domain-containing protein [Streptomyces apocyni]|uniref:DUF1707 and FHA domain-containing protein n=1 Tax=Streptomyces apocyni TaxID=2654677 RepID=UPI0012EAB4D7|nr:DUF1707 and FHA domain-containing protein [Streptomyces apocyni]
MTSSFEFPTSPERVSDAERDKALQLLRDGAVQGRLSHDTFVRRMGLALGAHRPDELAALTADLPRRQGRLTRLVTGAVGAVSAFTVRVRGAWQAERLPQLLLPLPASAPHPLRIGRDPASGLRLTHESVSRAHAELRAQSGRWVLYDLGSTNGTSVNGRRVLGAAIVQVGDQVSFGSVSYRLSVQ